MGIFLIWAFYNPILAMVWKEPSQMLGFNRNRILAMFPTLALIAATSCAVFGAVKHFRGHSAPIDVTVTRDTID